MLFWTLAVDRTTLLSRISDEYRANFFRISSDWRISYNEPSYDISDVAWDEVPISILSIVEEKMMFLTAKGCPGMGREVGERGDLDSYCSVAKHRFFGNRFLVSLILF
jgi:hypothetical protein